MRVTPFALLALSSSHNHDADMKAAKHRWSKEANEGHGHAHTDHGHAHDHTHSHQHHDDGGCHGHSHNGMDVQEPPKEKFQEKKQYIAEQTLEDKIDVWFKALFATLLISAAPYFILFSVPIESNTEENKPYLNILLAFASGGLLGDAFLHLIPHASHSHLPDNEDHGHSHDHTHEHSHDEESHGHSHSADMAIGLMVLLGIIAFMCVELFVRHMKGGHGHSHGGHSHSHAPKKAVEEKKDEKSDEKAKKAKKESSDDESSDKEEEEEKEEAEKESEEEKTEEKTEEQELAVAGWLNLAADFAHNFTDGLAIGASFLAGENIGIVTTLTILLHEVPHEIGDFAILIQSGATKERAMMLQLVTALGAMMGTVVGLLLGGTFGAVSIILPFTAGGFIYIATVGVIPELLANEKATPAQNIKEIIAMFLGIGLMVVIGWLE